LKPSGTDTGQKQGFALVIALSLMALLLLLMLSMSILLRVESNASSMGLAQLRAREAARLALRDKIWQSG
jgi:Tfp pilus assembly protein PilX